ncbi:MAG: trehalose phosphatase, partial [Isosphaeraceae bacterium]
KTLGGFQMDLLAAEPLVIDPVAAAYDEGGRLYEDVVRDPDKGGIGIIVRHDDDGDRATAARFALDSPALVREFAEALTGRPGRGSR